MSKQIELSELQRRGRAILDDLSRDGEPYVVARDGEPEAALIRYSEFLRLRRGASESADEHFDRVIARLRRLNTGLSDEQVAKDVEQAIAEVRSGST